MHARGASLARAAASSSPSPPQLHAPPRMRIAQRAASALARRSSSSPIHRRCCPAVSPSSSYQMAAASSHVQRSNVVTAVAQTEATPAVPSAEPQGLKKLQELRWRSSFASALPADPDTSNSVRQVSGAAFSYVAPTPTSGAGSETVVAFSPEVAADLLGLDPRECETEAFAALFAGNVPERDLPSGMRPYAAAYAGHQFGSFAGQLGDGRAICLGDVEAASTSSSSSSSSSSPPPSHLPPSPPFPAYPLPNPAGFYELQLKGAGTTPYSRFADGRAVLRSSVRELVASEAMHALAIPTTRALSLVLTGDQVVRDQFYDGRAKLELGAVVCRVSPCFVRFGSFELPAARGDPGLARKLLDFVAEKHYPHLVSASSSSSSSSSSSKSTKSPGLPLLLEVAERTGKTVAAWQACGFVHGVLNTDNCSILGETIDYGPYGWVEAFDVDFTPNTSDLPGRRYSFRNQPAAVAWNVERLAAAFVMAELVEDLEDAGEAVEVYSKALSSTYEGIVASKMGLPSYDKALAVAWLSLLSRAKADWTNGWRALSSVEPVSDSDEASLAAPPPLELARALARSEPVPFSERGSRSRPAGESWESSGIPEEIIPDAKAFLRLYRAELGRAAREGSDALWPSRPKQDVSNPAYVPRNHLMHAATEAIEGGGGGKSGGGGDGGAELLSLLEVLRDPFTLQEGKDKYRVPAPLAPREGVELLSCSS